MNLLRRFNPAIHDLLQPYKVTRDEDMPYAYQFANPKGLPYRNDLGFMNTLPALQPWQKMKRMDFFYRPPMPFRIKSGNKVRVDQIIDPSYPLAPGAEVFYKDVYTVGGKFSLPHITVDQAGEGLTIWEAYLGGKWVECFWRYHKNLFGKRFSAYSGARPDYAVGFDPAWKIRPDTGCHFPDVSASFVREV